LWTTEELELDCEVVMLPFPPRYLAKDFLLINPLGTVPALVDNGVVMTESVAIAQYLATRYGPTQLVVAADEPEYGDFLDFLHHSEATLTFPQTVYIRFHLLEKAKGLDEAGQLYADWFVARLARAELRLGEREFICANRFTIADIAMAYPLLLAQRIGLGERLSPVLSDYLGRLMDREAFKRASAREVAESERQGVPLPTW